MLRADSRGLHRGSAGQGAGLKAPIRLRLQATRYPHWGRYTGVGQFARYLDPARYRVTEGLAADNDSGLPIPWPAARNGLRHRVQRDGMAWYKLSDLAAEMKLTVAAVAGRVDIVHFLDGEHGVQFLPRWIARAPGCRTKVVASFHQPPQILAQLLNPAVLRKLDRVVLISPSQYEFFAARVPEEKIVTILHGIDTEFFYPAPQPLVTGKLRCLTVGHWLRDWAAIAAAVDRLSDRDDIEFHIVTGATTGLEGRRNVRIHQGVSDVELRALNQSADIILLPFTDSTANNSLLEGMACGVPVISTNLLSVRTYVGREAGVLLDREGGSDLADAIVGLKADPERRAAMGKAARRRALELAWTQITREYEALYEALAESD